MKDLKKADIDEVKSLGKPPAGVVLTMHATCVMFGIKGVKDKDADGKKFDNYFAAAKVRCPTQSRKLNARESRTAAIAGPGRELDEKRSPLRAASSAQTHWCSCRRLVSDVGLTPDTARTPS